MKDKTSIILVGIIVVLALVLFVGCSDDSNDGTEKSGSQKAETQELASQSEKVSPSTGSEFSEKIEERSLISDLERARVVAWIGPHPDDEIYVSGILAYSALGLGNETYSISLHNKGGSAFPPGAGPADRFQDNQDFKNLVGLTDYLYGDFSSYPRNKETATKMYLKDIVKELGIDLIITYENTNGGYGHHEHIQVSGWITEFAHENDIMLYYMINRDPIATLPNNPSIDPLPITDTLNLDQMSIVKKDGEKATLWEMKQGVMEVYYSSVPMVVRLVDDKELYNNIRHEENYRLVN